MRQVFLDTETTGLDHDLGDRIIEVGCIEMIGRRLTGREFQRYVNPERPVGEGAQHIHGITDEDLAGKPTFAQIAAELIEFVRGAEVIIHNAKFDVAFLDMELARAGLDPIETVCTIVDNLALARERHPGKRNTLDALCERYGVSNAHRTLHGARLDAMLLAEVYVAMTRGQDGLAMDLGGSLSDEGAPLDASGLIVLAATEAEAAEHAALLDGLAGKGGPAVWRRDAAA